MNARRFVWTPKVSPAASPLLVNNFPGENGTDKDVFDWNKIIYYKIFYRKLRRRRHVVYFIATVAVQPSVSGVLHGLPEVCHRIRGCEKHSIVIYSKSTR